MRAFSVGAKNMLSSSGCAMTRPTAILGHVFPVRVEVDCTVADVVASFAATVSAGILPNTDSARGSLDAGSEATSNLYTTVMRTRDSSQRARQAAAAHPTTMPTTDAISS